MFKSFTNLGDYKKNIKPLNIASVFNHLLVEGYTSPCSSSFILYKLQQIQFQSNENLLKSREWVAKTTILSEIKILNYKFNYNYYGTFV